MANPDLGLKQICPNCQTKFYDLNRRPAHCPKCSADFDPDEALKSRRVRARSATPDYDAEDVAEKPVRDEDEAETEEVTPELDAAEAEAPVASDEEDDAAEPAAEGAGADIGVGFEEESEPAEEEGVDVPFLEDEEDLDEEIEGLPEEGEER